MEDSALVSANNDFAFRLYSELSKSDSGNLFFSPYGIMNVMGMNYEGAAGETADQMLRAFKFPKDDGQRRQAFNSMNDRLNGVEVAGDSKDGRDYKLSTANGLWIDARYEVAGSFIDAIRHYGVELKHPGSEKGYGNKSADANKWIERNTGGRFPSHFKEREFVPDNKMKVVNTIYFKGKWEDEFKKGLTAKKEFRVSDVASVPAQTMRRGPSRYYYAEDKNFQLLRMPYKGGELSMNVLLPHGDRLGELERLLDADYYKGMKADSNRERVYVELPKFEMTKSMELTEPVSKMGAPLPFDMYDADFSRINGGADPRNNLYIGSLSQEAYVKTDEEGTEAVAVTSSGSRLIGATMHHDDYKEFIADHPFMFAIDDSSGATLFMGRVSDPTDS